MTTNKLKCNPGNYQCGGRCLSNKKKCIVKLSPAANEAANQLFDLMEKVDKKDLAVNTAGTVGGIAGGAAGPIGAVAGDLVASTAARHTLLLKESYDAIKDTDEFKAMKPWDKAFKVLEGAKSQEAKDVAAGDIEGFVIGNVSAAVLNAIPGIGGIPLKGAIAASVLVPKIQQYRRLKAQAS